MAPGVPGGLSVPSTFGTIAGAGIPPSAALSPGIPSSGGDSNAPPAQSGCRTRTSRIPDHPGRREDGEARVRRAGLPRRALRSPERSHPSRLLRQLLPPLPFWSACRARPTPSPNSSVAPHCGTNEQPSRLPFSKHRKHIVAGPLPNRARFNLLLGAKALGDLVFDGWVKIRAALRAGASPTARRGPQCRRDRRRPRRRHASRPCEGHDHIGDDGSVGEGGDDDPDTVIARDEHQKVARTQTGKAYRHVLLRFPRVSVLWSASAREPTEKVEQNS